MQSDSQFLPDLAQILPQQLRLLPVPRRLECLVQREARLARNGKLLERAVDQRLLGRAAVVVGLDLRQTFRHKQDAVDEEAVGGTLDFEVAEESVGAEERQDFVEDVIGFAVWVDIEWVGGGGERGESVGWPASFGAER
jgi:hypothetical protein